MPTAPVKVSAVVPAGTDGTVDRGEEMKAGSTRTTESTDLCARINASRRTLADQIRKILNITEETDPAKITDMVLEGMSRDDIEFAVIALLRAYVVDIMRGHRRTPGASVHGNGQAGGRPAETRADRWRAMWRAELFARYYDPADGNYYLLGDFTREQHQRAAVHRSTLAEANAKAANWHYLMADALKQNEAATTADLPADKLDTLLTERLS